MEGIGDLTTHSDDLEKSKRFKLPSMSSLILGTSDSEDVDGRAFEVSMRFEDLMDMVPPEGVDFHASYDQVHKAKLNIGKSLIHLDQERGKGDVIRSSFLFRSSDASSRSQSMSLPESSNRSRKNKKNCTRIKPKKKFDRSRSGENYIPKPCIAFSANPPHLSSKVRCPRAVPPAQSKALQNHLQSLSESISYGLNSKSDSQLAVKPGMHSGFRSANSSFSILPPSFDGNLAKEARHRRIRAMHHSFTVMPSESGAFSAAPLDVSNVLRMSRSNCNVSEKTTSTNPSTNLTPMTPRLQMESNDVASKIYVSSFVDPVNHCNKNRERSLHHPTHSSRRRPSRSKSTSAHCRLPFLSTASETSPIQSLSLDSLTTAILDGKLKYDVSKRTPRNKRNTLLAAVVPETPRRKLVSCQSRPTAACEDGNTTKTPMRRKKSPDTARFRRSLASQIVKDAAKRKAKRKTTASVKTATTNAIGSSEQKVGVGSRYFVKSKSKRTSEELLEESSTTDVVTTTSDIKCPERIGMRPFRSIARNPDMDDHNPASTRNLGVHCMQSLIREQNSIPALSTRACRRGNASLTSSISGLHASVGRLSLDDSFSVSRIEGTRATLLVSGHESFNTTSKKDFTKNFNDTIQLVRKWKRESKLEDEHSTTSLGSLEGLEQIPSKQQKEERKMKKKQRQKNRALSRCLTSLPSSTEPYFLSGSKNCNDRRKRKLVPGRERSKHSESSSSLTKNDVPSRLSSMEKTHRDPGLDALEAKEVSLRNCLTKTPETQRNKLDSYFIDAFKRNFAKRSTFDEAPDTPTTITTFLTTSTM